MDELNPASPPIDLEGFRLAMRKADIEEIVEPALEVFVEESQRLVSTLEEAHSAGDADTLRRAAHTLKGSAGNVHAGELARRAGTLEAAAERGDLAGAKALIESAAAEYAAVIDHLEQNGHRQ